MNRMKKITALLLTGIMLVIGLSACSSKGETAEQAVKSMLDAVKAQDEEKASKYVDYNALMGSSDDTAEGQAETEEMVKLLMEKLSYNVESSKEDGNTATVDVSITNLDMSIVMTQFVQKVMEVALAGTVTDENAEEESLKIFKELLGAEGTETVTTKITLSLTKTDGQWKVDATDELIDAILGGFMTAMSGMGGVTE